MQRAACGKAVAPMGDAPVQLALSSAFRLLTFDQRVVLLTLLLVERLHFLLLPLLKLGALMRIVSLLTFLSVADL